MAICANCGAELPPRFRFCGACGAPLEQLPEREVRKLVTVLFSDLVDSTALGERLDPERWRQVLSRYFEAIEQLIAAHGGLVEKFVGDAVMAVFGLPRAHEDDALRALKAALAVRERLPQLAEETGCELAFRTGINSGEVVAGSGQTLATGDAVNVAARLEQAAGPGEILLGAETVRLLGQAVAVDPLEPLALQGKAEPVGAYRFRALAKAEREPQSPFVGRRRELVLLRDAFDRVLEERELHLVTLLGPAGIGKSRLACEFADSLAGEAQIARGRCLSYGQALSYWPLVEALRTLGETAAVALEQLVEGGATSPQQLAWSVQQALEQAAQERPLLLLLEDLHWAEPALLDLLDSVAELSRDAPVLLLCLARPELLEQRPGWGGGKLNATSLLLGPLPQQDSVSLLSCLDCPGPAEERALELAAGNPLFLEELSAFLSGGGNEDELPPRIQALLQARLDLLPEPQRLLLATAALEGTVFHRGALAALVPEELQVALPVELAALTRTLLIRPAAPEFPGERAFRFRHQLIRDTAYGELPKADRARLHERFAGWLEQRTGERGELAEIGAYHLEQAALAKRELGEPDVALEQRAATALAAAAERARLRVDLGAAADLWSRALALLDDEVRVPELQLELALVLAPLGKFEEAQRLLQQAEEQTCDTAVAAAVRLARLQARLTYVPEGVPSAIRRECRDAIPLFKQRGDHRALARAWHTRAGAESVELQMQAAARAWAIAARHAHLAGDRALEALVLSERIAFLAASRMPWSTAIEELEQLMERFPGESAIRRFLALYQAVWAIDQGRAQEGRVLAREALDSTRRAGFALVAGVWTAAFGWAEFLAGDVVEGERLALTAIHELEQHHERGYLSFAKTILADIRIAQGRHHDAIELADEAEQDGGPDDRGTLVDANSVRARASAQLGEIEHARVFAATAVAVAGTTDSLQAQAGAQYALACVLAAAEEFSAALEAAEEAGRLWTMLERTLFKRLAEALIEQISRAMTSARAPTPAG